MSTTIDQRVVEMRFDNQQFENGVRTSLNSIDKLKQGLKFDGATKGLANVETAARGVTLSSLSNAVETVGLKFNGLYTIADQTLRNITNSAVNAGKRIISALTIDPIKTGFSEYETQINAVQTILANTSSKGTTLQEVNAALDTLNTYADKTIYNFTEMTKNIGTFTAAGVDLDTSVKAIQGIANLAAVSGSTSQQASTAMYQLSQALAAGKVNLMDWNSVVNAGMGGQVFQDALVRTAAAMSGVSEETFRATNIGNSFRESLKDGWLTTEVLTTTLEQFTMSAEEGSSQWNEFKKTLQETGYTEEQAEAILKMANTASDAATKVKTFTQLWDTLKESAQSGWTSSWEIIVGDFEEAKGLLTEISDTIGPMISAAAEARNEVLSGGLSSGWKQLLGAGIADEEGFKDSIKNVAETHGVAIDEMIDDEHSFEDVLRTCLSDGSISADMLGKSVYDLATKMNGMSAEERTAAGYTEEHVKQINDLVSGLQSGSVSMDEFAEKIMKPSGRENLIQSLWNAFKGLMSVVTPIKEAFREIFPPITADQLYKLTENIRIFTEKLTLSDNASDNLKRTFKGLFAVLDIVKQAFSAVFKAISPLFGGLDNLGGGILEITASWGDWLVKLSNTIKETDIFNKAIQSVINVIKTVVEAVKSFVNTVKEKFVCPGLEVLQKFLDRVRERFSQVEVAAVTMETGVIAVIKAMGTALANSEFLKGLQALWNGIKTIGTGIAKVLGTLMGGAVDAIGNIDFNNVFDLFNAASFGGIAVAITTFLNNMSEPLEGVQGILEGVTGVLDGVKGSLEAWQMSLKSDVLLKIAGAIGILTVSLVALSLMDSDKLSAALGAVTMMFADLMGSLAIFGKISTGFDGVSRACGAMLAISVSVLILASALKKIGELGFENMAVGLVGVLGLTAIVVAAAKILGSGSSTIVEGALQMVIFAAALKVLASVCTDLSALEWEELGKGLVGVGVLMGYVLLFLNNTSFSGKAISTATGMVIMAAALKILASVCNDFGQMKWEDIGKGLVAVGALLAEVALFTKLTGNAKNVISTSVALIAIAGAMKIFASAIHDMSDMSWEELGKGLAGMAGSLLAVTLALKFLPKDTVGLGVGLIAVSAALLVMAEAMDKMSGMTWEEVARGLVALGGSLGLLAIALNLMKGTLGGSAALIVAAAAVAILAPSLRELGSMSWMEIAKGLLTLAGAFAVVGLAGLILKPLIPSILGLAAAFALIGVAVLGIGAGLVLAGVGLSAIAVGFSALVTSLAAGATSIVASLTVIVMGLVSLIPTVAEKIGEALIVLCQVIADGAPAIGEAVNALVLTVIDVLITSVPALVEGCLSLINQILSALAEHTPETQITDFILQFLIGVLDSIAQNLPALTQSVVNLFMTLFSSVIDALCNIDVATVVKGLVGVGLIAGIMYALSSVAALIPSAMAGVLGVGAVIAELALVLAAIGAIGQIPGLSWLIDEGGQVLEGIGTAIGSLIGGIAGGIMSGVTSQFPQIGDDLAAFMDNVQPFIEGTKHIDSSTMDGVKALADIFLLLTGANILNGLSSWVTGGSSIASFAEDLIPLGEGLSGFSSSVSSIQPDKVKAAAGAAKTLAEMTSYIPNEGGMVSWFAGENSIAGFAQELAGLGIGLRNFSTNVGDTDPEKIKTAAIAAKALAEMTSYIPNEGGVASWFAGENNISSFAQQLAGLGLGLSNFSTNVANVDPERVTAAVGAAKVLAEMTSVIPNEGGVASWFAGENSISKFAQDLAGLGTGLSNFSTNVANADPEKIKAAAGAAKSLAEMTSVIPNEGGMVAWFTGENSLAKFARELAGLGTGLSNFSSNVSGIDPENIKAAANAAKTLAEMTSYIPNEGGIASWFAGENSIAGFAQELATLGLGIRNFSINAAGVEAQNVASATQAAGNIISMCKEMEGVDFSNAGNFAQALTDLGNAGIDGFVKAFENSNAKLSSAVTTMLSSVEKNISSGQTKVSKAFKAVVDKILSNIEDKLYAFKKSGKEIVTKFGEGITSAKSTPSDKIKSILASMVTDIRNKHSNFKSAGKYLVEGFADGISANTFKAKAQAKAMAKAALEAAEEALGIKSPSREGRRIGKFFDLGFIEGIDGYSSKVYDSAYGMADSAKSGLSNAISKVRDVIDMDLDSQPTIRPVLDLSNVEAGVGTMNGMLNLNPSMGVLANVNSINSMMNGRQNRGNDDVVSAINKLGAKIGNMSGDNYNIGGITYDDGSNVQNAVHTLVRAARVERRR